MQDQGISVLNMAIKACTKEIEKNQGKLTVRDAPRAVILPVMIKKKQAILISLMICRKKS